jgi:hypothetical protein
MIIDCATMTRWEAAWEYFQDKPVTDNYADQIKEFLDKNYPDVNWRVSISKYKGIELRWDCSDPALVTFYQLKWA